MKKSPFFEELSAAYSAEIDDLTADTEGKSVLLLRLKEKRRELDTLLQMIDFAPEMVLPVFYGAFTFPSLQVLSLAVLCEPDDDDFPAWDVLSQSLVVADWAAPFVARVLAVSGGEQFMVLAALAEYLRVHDQASQPSVSDEKNEFDEDEDDEGEEGDLAEAGADWLSEQGFDSQNG